MSEPLVYIIILTFNDRVAALRCLASVRAMDYANYCIVIVDNASSDDTVTAIRQACPDCEIIVNASNLGFGAGCNVGITYALENNADFILLLNQDTLVAPDMLTALVRAAQAKPAAGIIGPKTFFLNPAPDGRPRLFYAGAWRRRLPLEQRIPGIEQPDVGRYDRPVRVDYVWGHGMFLRAALLRTVGLFDPAFFMYYEDLDLCRRAAAAGYELWYEPQARIWHDTPDGARASLSQPWRWRCKVDSMRIFYRKHYGCLWGELLAVLNVLDEARQRWGEGHWTAARHLAMAWLRSVV